LDEAEQVGAGLGLDRALDLAQRYYRADQMVEGDLRAGRLTELLRDHAGASRPFSLLCPANRYMPLRARVLIDFLIERLATR
jgi:DNA-binding transcriptional LysR family regulator